MTTAYCFDARWIACMTIIGEKMIFFCEPIEIPRLISLRNGFPIDCSLLLPFACVDRKSGGGGSLWSSRAIRPYLYIKISCLAGAERELQLRPLLPAGEWKSREIPGRGAPPRRLPLQWTRRILGGKAALSFSFLPFFTSSSGRSRDRSQSESRSCADLVYYFGRRKDNTG